MENEHMQDVRIDGRILNWTLDCEDEQWTQEDMRPMVGSCGQYTEMSGVMKAENFLVSWTTIKASRKFVCENSTWKQAYNLHQSLHA
jgi:hypothetical protein